MHTSDFVPYLLQTRNLYRRCLAPVLEAYGLSQLEADVLGFLANNPALDTANQIVEYRMLPKANVSNAVESLRQRGYLQTQRDAQDRRRIHLTLTEAAQPAAGQIQQAQRAFYQRIYAGFTEEERRLTLQFGKRMYDNINEAMGGNKL